MNPTMGVGHWAIGRVGSTRPILVTLLMFLARHAQAEDETAQARADRLFSEALQLMNADRCQDAIRLFHESQKLDPAAATLMNTATCYARLGKTATAFHSYQEAARGAILEGKDELRLRADQAISRLTPRLTRLRIVPLGSASLPTIRVNGEVVTDVRDPILLDPGENIIEATAPGREQWRRTVNAQGGGTLMLIEVPELPAAREASAGEPRNAVQSASTTHHDTDQRPDLKPIAIIAAGVGVTGLAVGSILGLSARSKYDASNAYCQGQLCKQPGLDLREAALDRANLATWTMGFGLVSVATAGVLWFVTANREQDHRLSVSPWVQTAQPAAGLALEGEL